MNFDKLEMIVYNSEIDPGQTKGEVAATAVKFEPKTFEKFLFKEGKEAQTTYQTYLNVSSEN